MATIHSSPSFQGMEFLSYPLWLDLQKVAVLLEFGTLHLKEPCHFHLTLLEQTVL